MGVKRWRAPGSALFGIATLLLASCAPQPTTPGDPPAPPVAGGPTPPADLAIRSVYTAPTGAVYVSRTGNDSAGTGAVDRPFASLARAVAVAPSGGTIVLRDGVYREGAIAIGKPLTIQGYKGESAWLDGSTVVATGWAPAGRTWHLASSPSAGLCRYGIDPCVQDASQVDPSYPLAASPQSVIRNGLKLREVGSLAAVVPGTFYYNPVAATLDVGDDPAGATVEVVTRSKALDVSASNVTLRGLGVRNYGSIVNSSAVRGAYNLAAVQSSNNHGFTVENVVFYQNSARGLYVNGSSDVTVRSSTFVENGFNGFDSYSSTRLLLERSRIVRNNAEHFAANAAAFTVAAGSKMVLTTAVTVRDNVFDSNVGTGWWCDEQCTGAVVVRNLVSRNTAHGLMYEISGTGIIASNLVVANQGNGIYVLGPDNKVWNNTSVGNRQALVFYEDSRNRWALDNCRNNVARNNILAASVGTVRNNIGEWAKVVDVEGFTYPESVDPGVMVADLDDNAYDPGVGAGAPQVLGWGARGVINSFRDLTEVRAATGRETHGVAANGRTSLVVDPSTGLVQPAVSSTVVQPGAPLPADVAAALGLAAGTVLNLGSPGQAAY